MATVNFIKNSTQSGAAMRRAIRYVERGDKTRDCALVSGQNCTPRLAEQEFLATRQANHKGGGRWFYHYTQSFSPQENVTPEQAHEIAKEFAARAWPESEVVIATHVDAAHIHSHFIVNAVCFETGKMLRQHPNTLQRLRAVSDELCMAHGLSVLPKGQKRSDKVSAREYRSAAKGQSWKFQLMATVDECMRHARTQEEFISLMRGEGYDVRWTDTRKNITYTTPKGKKCRDDRLHDVKYLKEAMEHEFRIRAVLIAGGIETAQPADSAGSVGNTSHGRGVGESADSHQRNLPVDGGPIQPTGGADAQRGDPRDGEGSGCAEAANRDDQRYVRTGWEKERAALFTSAHFAPQSGAGGVVLSADALGSIGADLVSLVRRLEHTESTAPIKDSTTIPGHSDSILRSREREKKIALGHKADDHEEQQRPNLSM